jgi:DNA-directed RNA polymerase beta subunit
MNGKTSKISAETNRRASRKKSRPKSSQQPEKMGSDDWVDATVNIARSIASKHTAEYGLVNSQLGPFDHLINVKLPELISNFTLNHKPGSILLTLNDGKGPEYVLSFSNPFFEEPTIKEGTPLVDGNIFIKHPEGAKGDASFSPGGGTPNPSFLGGGYRDSRPLFPLEALNRGLDYTSEIYLDWTLETKGKSAKSLAPVIKRQTQKKFAIGNIFVPLKGCLCNLYNKPESYIAAHLEDTASEGGYFINNGLRKYITMQERVANDYVCLYKNDPKKKGGKKGETSQAKTKDVDDLVLYSELKCSLKVKPSGTSMVRVGFTEDSSQGIRCIIPFVKEHRIPLCVLFKAYGLNEQEMVNTVIKKSDPPEFLEEFIVSLDIGYDHDRESALEYIRSRMRPPESCFDADVEDEMEDELDDDQDDDDVLISHFSGGGATKKKGVSIAQVEKLLYEDIFPNIAPCTSAQIRKLKRVSMLGIMTRRAIMGKLGLLGIEDRDKMDIKRMHTIESMFLIQFYSSFKRLMSELIKLAAKKKGTELSLGALLSYIQKKKSQSSSIVSQNFQKALSSNQWTADLQSKASGICQKLELYNLVAGLSDIRRSKHFMPAEGAIVLKPRALDPSQKSGFCASETPEGNQAGLVKRLAIYGGVTNGVSDMSPILTDILTRLGVVVNEDNRGSDIFLNGEFMGRTRDLDALVAQLRRLRTQTAIPWWVSITPNPQKDELNICSDQGRLYRPVFVVQDNKVRVPANWKDLTIPQLLRSGCLELLDKKEDESCVVASCLADVAKGGYSHMELDPCSIFGLNAGLVVKSNSNQSPRITYASQMTRQAIGMPVINWRYTYEKKIHVLRYYQRPVCQTQIQRDSGYVNYPAGVNAVVMVAPLFGANQEDSIVMKKESVERGLLTSDRIVTHACSLSRVEDGEKWFGRPQDLMKPYVMDQYGNVSLCEDENSRTNIYTDDLDAIKRYVDELKAKMANPEGTNDLAACEKLDEDGVIRPGERVSPDDVLISIVHVKYKIEKDNPAEKNTRIGVYLFHEFIKYKEPMKGTVLGVQFSSNQENYKTAKVMVGWKMDVIPGNKVASQHGQKGVVGQIVEGINMPFTSEGITADYVINPLALPSRMTIGQLIESITGKAFCLSRSGDSVKDLFTQKDKTKEKEWDDAVNQNATQTAHWKKMNDRSRPQKDENGEWRIVHDGHVGENVDRGVVPRDKGDRYVDDFFKSDHADLTPFHRNFELEQVARELTKNGYNASGKDMVMDGTTGRRMNCLVFTGVVYYQALKHLILDKKHECTRAKKQSMNRQPVKGKSRGGSLRFGVMESDQVRANGLAFFLKDRLFEQSDKYKMWVCNVCGLQATVNQDQTKKECRVCGGNQVTHIDIPYSAKLLGQELLAMGIATRTVVCERGAAIKILECGNLNSATKKTNKN